MALIPPPTNSTISAIDRYHESRNESKRYHLGCSLLGHPCRRWLWLSFRWAVVEQFQGRMLRLFRRGQNEEATIVADLRAIGVEVAEHDGSGKQLRVDFGCQVSGSMDGVAVSGLPESPNKPHVLEFKTHSIKSFNELEKKGVEASKPMHYAQMQLYMHGTGIDRAMYIAVCKDNDQLYTERVRRDKDLGARLVEKGQYITQTDRMPEPLSVDPTWYQCRFCPAHGFCHKKEPVTERHCRVCRYGTVTDDTWQCGKWGSTIPKEAQPVGCEHFELHGDLLTENR